MSTTTKTDANSTERTHKKRSGTTEAVPHHQKLINGTTTESKVQRLAEFLLDHIGDREHPLKRPANRSVDRYLRGLIQEKNAAGEDIIINNGEGYYRPGPDDGPAVREYWAKEKHRAHEIEKKADRMMMTYLSKYGYWNVFTGGTD